LGFDLLHALGNTASATLALPLAALLQRLNQAAAGKR
jgi:hypothetical protein